MKYPTENEVAKLSMGYRVLAGFILFCGLFAAVALVFAIVTEPFHPTAIIGVIVISVMLYVSGSIVFKGFAPKYLFFTHGPK